MDFHLDSLLNLPNIVADSYSSTLDAIVVKLQLVNAGINCPNCNEYISQVHQTRPVGSPANMVISLAYHHISGRAIRSEFRQLAS
jgi:hypothetical protein